MGVLCALALVMAACGGDTGGTGKKNTEQDAGADAGGGADAGADADTGSNDVGDTGSADAAPVVCTPDPTLIAQKRECLRDEQCPCGSHCWLGQCQASCQSDTDCADGTYCDQFGTCRDAQDTAKVALVARRNQGRLDPRRSLATLSTERTKTAVLVRASDGPIDQGRIVAGDGLLVAVTDGSEPADGDFSKEISLDQPVEVDATVTVWTERDPADTTAGVVRNEVTLYDSGGHRSTITVTDDPNVLGGTTASTLAGVYSGVARLVARGSTGGVGDNMAAPGRAESVPLTAKIYDTGSDLRVVIEDDLDVLHPDGQWIGTLSSDGQTLSMPAFDAIPLDQIALANLQVVARPTDVRVQGAPTAASTDWSGVLRFQFDLQYDGISATGALPTARWAIALSRTGDIPSGETAPDAQQDATLAYDTDQAADTPFDAETAFASITQTYPDDYTKWEAIRRVADESLVANDLNVCTKPLFPFADSADRRAYYESFNHSVYRDVIAGNVFAQGNTPSADAYNAWPVKASSASQTKTAGQLAAMGIPMYAEIFGGISDQTTPLYRARFSLASGFFSRTHSNTFDFAPPITLPNGKTVDNAIPCDIDFRDAPDTVALQGSSGPAWTFDVPNQDFDFCQDAAQRLDCQIVDVTSLLSDSERDMYPALHNSWTLEVWTANDFYSQRNATVDNVRFTKVCVPPALPVRCSEGLACESSAPAITGPAVPLHTLSGSTQADASGDLGCKDTSRVFGYPMDDANVAADTLVDDCVSDSQAMDAPLPSPSGTTAQDALTSIGWYADHGCFNPVQLVAGVALSSTQLRYWRGRVGTKATLADLLTIRLLQKWTDAHALIAGEALHLATFGHLNSQQATVEQMEDRLHQSLRAWSFLFQPRVATALFSLSPQALRNPDYRQQVAGATFADQPYNRQSAGLVVSLTQLLDAQMKLGNAIAQMRALRGANAEPDSLAELMRVHQVADSLIAALDARSRDVDGNYANWQDQYKSAERSVLGGWIKATNRIDGMIHGKNPLGIEDTDLPLYFRELHNDAVSRFGAISTFLLGDTNDSDAWAASLVRSASDAYDTAKQAYLSEEARMLNEQADDNAKNARVGNAKTDFGLLMIDMCGSQAFAGASPADVYDQGDWANFDASSCWYRSERSECAADGGTAGGTTEAARKKNSIAFSLCTSSVGAAGPLGTGTYTVHADVDYQGLSFPYYGQVPGWHYHNGVLTKIQQAIRQTWTSFPATKDVTMRLARAACATGSNGAAVCAPAETTQTVGLLYDPLASAPPNPCANADVPNFPGILPTIERQTDGTYEAVCAPNTAAGFAGPTYRLPLSDAELDGFAAASADSVAAAQTAAQCRRYIPALDATPVVNWNEAPQTCYSGSVGQQVFATRGLVTDIESARDELKQQTDSYRIAMDSCFIQQAGDQQLQQAQQTFQQEMNRLGDGKLAADLVSTWAGAAGDCLATLSGAEKPWSFGLAGGACGAYAVGAAGDTASLALQNDMDRAERQHDTTMQAIEQSTDERRCFKEAELELVGVRSAYLDIKRAQQELASSYLDVQHTLDSLQAQYSAALGDIDDAQSSQVLVPAQSPWYNEELTDYRRKFVLARRAAYLAVRAVEYEYQMSSSYRSDVLQAETPLELEQVLTELRQVSNTNSVQGARPAELTEVVSLKDHLLQLGDRSGAPAGWQTLTPSERFRKMLVDPKYEVYQDGVFVGRRIPFEIAPLSVLNRGQYQGIPIVSDNSCAERLWSLNVTVEGKDGEVFRGLNPTINLEVRKRNTFYSNYCDSTQGDFQVASVRPQRNLFREPGVGEGISGVTGQSEADGFSKARVQARVNVAPQDFSSDSYTDGASTELATRGLFGQYALFIPATSLAPVTNGQPSGDGLVLNKIDDILLRVDYVSVAR